MSCGIGAHGVCLRVCVFELCVSMCVRARWVRMEGAFVFVCIMSASVCVCVGGGGLRL